MASELPYFKFEPNQWDNGNIQICTREEKGLFIDLCSMYWSRTGNMPFKLANMKLANGDATLFDNLINENLITISNNQISISFLDEQLNKFDIRSKVNSDNAKSRWLDKPERIKGNIVYVIRCWDDDEEFLKIGITTTSISKRFSGKMPYNYEVIIIDEYDSISLESQYQEIAKGSEYIANKEFSGYLECYKMSVISELTNFAKIRNAKFVRNTCENDAIREEKRREEERKEDKKKNDVFSFKKSLIDLGVKEPFLSDWLSVRKGKRATNTKTAFNKFLNEAKKTSLSINEVVKICAENSWSGFEKKWMDNANPKPEQPSFHKNR